MPPRRPHTKSRNGCDQCKKRRVKCNEQGPPCSNCISRELQCSYLKAPTPRPCDSSSPVYPSLGRELPPPPPPSFTTGIPRPSTRQRELELMHKFSTDTYKSLSNEPVDYHVWQIIMPRKALDHDFLMSGILAVASLHTAATMEAPEALSYIDTALEYHNQAFAPFRHAIDNLTPVNCDAVFAHAVITTVVGIAIPRLTASRDESPSMTENIFVVFELLQGVSKIFRISRDWLKANLFTSHQQFFDDRDVPLATETEDALARLNTLNDNILSTTDPDKFRIIKDAIALLRRCFCRYTRDNDAASVLSWLAAVDKEFVRVLRSRQPISLLVLMHWGVLLGELDGRMWWARNSGIALVSELLVALRDGDGRGDERWEGAWLWPKERLGL